MLMNNQLKAKRAVLERRLTEAQIKFRECAPTSGRRQKCLKIKILPCNVNQFPWKKFDVLKEDVLEIIFRTDRMSNERCNTEYYPPRHETQKYGRSCDFHGVHGEIMRDLKSITQSGIGLEKEMQWGRRKMSGSSGMTNRKPNMRQGGKGGSKKSRKWVNIFKYINTKPK